MRDTGTGGYAKLALISNGYEEGDTWYRDMRFPGFNGETAPEGEDSLQWLARQIVDDRRFAEATVKFWWPAIMGSEIAEAPEAEDDADFEGLLLAANAQSAGGQASGARLPGRLLRRAGIQSEGPLGRDRAVEVVPGRCAGRCGSGSPGGAPACRCPTASDAGGACAEDGRPDRLPVGSPHCGRLPRRLRSSAPPAQWRIPAAVRRDRFGRNYGAGGGTSPR